METSLAYWVKSVGHGRLEETAIDSTTMPGWHRYRATHSGVSPGTERLVGLGQVPSSCQEAMSCRYMEGSFALPIKYGYCWVGVGEEGPHEGRRVFLMHPHQDRILADAEHVLPLPDFLPSHRATLIPNLETALNAVWDSGLDLSDPHSDQRVVIFGAGAVGLLLGFVLERFGYRPCLVEKWDRRRERARQFSWVGRVFDPREVESQNYSLAFHTTATEDGLQQAIDSVGFEGQVIELSWYGSRRVSVHLGGDFHYLRKQLIASQVAHVSASKRPQVSHRTRLEKVLDLLVDERLDEVLNEPVRFSDMPEFMAELYRGDVLESSPVIAFS